MFCQKCLAPFPGDAWIREIKAAIMNKQSFRFQTAEAEVLQPTNGLGELHERREARRTIVTSISITLVVPSQAL